MQRKGEAASGRQGAPGSSGRGGAYGRSYVFWPLVGAAAGIGSRQAASA